MLFGQTLPGVVEEALVREPPHSRNMRAMITASSASNRVPSAASTPSMFMRQDLR